MTNSTQLITDLKTALTTGQSATTAANSIAPAGVIQDTPGNIQGCIVGLNDVKRRLTEVLKDVDPQDPILAPLQGVFNSLN